jgi:hypothetical protein
VLKDWKVELELDMMSGEYLFNRRWRVLRLDTVFVFRFVGYG